MAGTWDGKHDIRKFIIFLGRSAPIPPTSPKKFKVVRTPGLGLFVFQRKGIHRDSKNPINPISLKCSLTSSNQATQFQLKSSSIHSLYNPLALSAALYNSNHLPFMSNTPFLWVFNIGGKALTMIHHLLSSAVNHH